MLERVSLQIRSFRLLIR